MPDFATAFEMPPGGAHRTRFGEFIIQVDHLGANAYSLKGWLPRDKEEFELLSPQPLAEEGLQAQDREIPAVDPGIGGGAPLPDGGGEQVAEVEGVGGDAEDEYRGQRAAIEAVAVLLLRGHIGAGLAADLLRVIGD